jgi:hypothetical protein
MSVGDGGISVGDGGMSVGDGGISVGVLVGRSVFVGTGEFVQVGTGVLVGAGTAVLVGAGLGRRVLVGPLKVGNRKAVRVIGVSEAVGLEVIVGRRVRVAVGINSAIACSVNAPAVFKLLTAESTIFSGWKAPAVADSFRSWMAIPETEHNRLIPIAPATKTASRPR